MAMRHLMLQSWVVSSLAMDLAIGHILSRQVADYAIYCHCPKEWGCPKQNFTLRQGAHLP